MSASNESKLPYRDKLSTRLYYFAERAAHLGEPTNAECDKFVDEIIGLVTQQSDSDAPIAKGDYVLDEAGRVGRVYFEPDEEGAVWVEFIAPKNEIRDFARERRHPKDLRKWYGWERGTNGATVQAFDDAAVDRACAAMFYDSWDGESDGWKSDIRRDMRAALKAAING